MLLYLFPSITYPSSASFLPRVSVCVHCHSSRQASLFSSFSLPLPARLLLSSCVLFCPFQCIFFSFSMVCLCVVLIAQALTGERNHSTQQTNKLERRRGTSRCPGRTAISGETPETHSFRSAALLYTRSSITLECRRTTTKRNTASVTRFPTFLFFFCTLVRLMVSSALTPFFVPFSLSPTRHQPPHLFLYMSFSLCFPNVCEVLLLFLCFAFASYLRLSLSRSLARSVCTREIALSARFCPAPLYACAVQPLSPSFFVLLLYAQSMPFSLLSFALFLAPSSLFTFVLELPS